MVTAALKEGKENHKDIPFPLGSRVKHERFGEGVVLNHEGGGEHARIQVRFASGAKWLVLEYSKLVTI